MARGFLPTVRSGTTLGNSYPVTTLRRDGLRPAVPVLHSDKVSIDLDSRTIDASVRLMRVSSRFPHLDSRRVPASVRATGLFIGRVGAGRLFLRTCVPRTKLLFRAVRLGVRMTGAGEPVQHLEIRRRRMPAGTEGVSNSWSGMDRCIVRMNDPVAQRIDPIMENNRRALDGAEGVWRTPKRINRSCAGIVRKAA